MKSIAIFSVLFACALTASIPSQELNAVEPYGLFEDVVNNTFNSIIEQIPDPVVIDKIDVPVMNVGDLDVNLTISNVKVTNLKGIVLTKIHVSLIPLIVKITATVPSLELTTDYTEQITNGSEIRSNAHGIINATITNLNVFIDASLEGSLIPLDFKIKDLSLGVPDLAKNTNVVAYITDEDDPDVAQDINDNIAYWIPNLLQLIDDNQEAISDVISPIIKDVVNGLLSVMKEVEQ